MPPVLLSVDSDTSRVIVTGDTRGIWAHRRTGIYLRDYLHATLLDDDRLLIPVGQERLGPLVRSIEDSLTRGGFQAVRSTELTFAIADFQKAEDQFVAFSARAKSIWANKISTEEFRGFANRLSELLPGRRLYDLQLLAAYHLAFAQNAANFSAPGVGKTSIVYGAFAYLRDLGDANGKFVNKLLVIGPLSSFGPWESEFQECFAREPVSHRLSGGVSPSHRKRILYSDLPGFRDADLVLASYQTAASDLDHIRHFLTRPDNNVMVVLDEAHKIKNVSGGIWAEAVLELARACSSRVVLTGTPAPNGYEDLFNLFRFIWPDHDVIKYHLQHLKEMTNNPFDPRIERLVDNVAPFFIRIRKSDLHIPEPIEHPPQRVSMGPRQQQIYRFIEDKYIGYLERRAAESRVKDVLARARLIRLMQAATNPALLRAPIEASLLDDSEPHGADLFIDDREILAQIQEYCDSEIPAKFLAALELVKSILKAVPDNKIVVWCVFIKNLFAMQQLLAQHGVESRLLYGGTPTESDESAAEIETREKIIKEFHRADSSFRVIIANPFAVGESISLHKVCHFAIYVERNFNAAAFLQSKDRIHRYGLPDDARIHYHYLLCDETIDGPINDRLLQKEAAMMKLLEGRQIPLISLNMEGDDRQEDTDDVRAIIRDYVQRRSTKVSTRE